MLEDGEIVACVGNYCFVVICHILTSYRVYLNGGSQGPGSNTNWIEKTDRPRLAGKGGVDTDQSKLVVKDGADTDRLYGLDRKDGLAKSQISGLSFLHGSCWSVSRSVFR